MFPGLPGQSGKGTQRVGMQEALPETSPKKFKGKPIPSQPRLLKTAPMQPWRGTGWGDGPSPSLHSQGPKPLLYRLLPSLMSQAEQAL